MARLTSIAVALLLLAVAEKSLAGGERGTQLHDEVNHDFATFLLSVDAVGTGTVVESNNARGLAIAVERVLLGVIPETSVQVAGMQWTYGDKRLLVGSKVLFWGIRHPSVYVGSAAMLQPDHSMRVTKYFADMQCNGLSLATPGVYDELVRELQRRRPEHALESLEGKRGVALCTLRTKLAPGLYTIDVLRAVVGNATKGTQLLRIRNPSSCNYAAILGDTLLVPVADASDTLSITTCASQFTLRGGVVPLVNGPIDKVNEVLTIHEQRIYLRDVTSARPTER